MIFADYLAENLRTLYGRELPVVSIGGGLPTTVADLRGALDALDGTGEVFMVMPMVLIKEQPLGHLWPVAARLDDDGDVLIYLTDGDTAQSDIEVDTSTRRVLGWDIPTTNGDPQ